MSELKYTVADFKSDQEVKWCPGCGDYAVLSAIQKAMPQIAANADVDHSRFAVVSGIGCSSRFPYYVSTYGFTASTAVPMPSLRVSRRPIPI